MEVWDSYAVFPSSGELGEWGVESYPLAGGEKTWILLWRQQEPIQQHLRKIRHEYLYPGLPPQEAHL